MPLTPCDFILDGPFTIFYGLDVGTSDQPTTVRLTPDQYVNSNAARDVFLEHFEPDLPWEGFEQFDNETSPLTIETFSAAGEVLITALTTPGTVRVRSTDSLSVGRFAIWGPDDGVTPDSSWRWLETTASWRMDFENPIVALGFYAVDLGDFQADLLLTFTFDDDTTATIRTPYERNAIGNLPNNSSVSFIGVISGRPFTRVTFTMFQLPDSSFDIFGFDRFYAVAGSQVTHVGIGGFCGPAKLLVDEGCGPALLAGRPDATCGLPSRVIDVVTSSLTSGEHGFAAPPSSCGHSLMTIRTPAQC